MFPVVFPLMIELFAGWRLCSFVDDRGVIVQLLLVFGYATQCYELLGGAKSIDGPL